MERLFSSDAINNMFDSDNLPCGSKTNSILGRKSLPPKSNHLSGMRVFDPFEIMDQAVEAGDESLFNRFFEETKFSSVEVQLGFGGGVPNINTKIEPFSSEFDDVEDFFSNIKFAKRCTRKNIGGRPFVVIPRKLRLV